MVWESPLRQLGQGSVDEASPSEKLLSSPAEIQVREIASKIGLFEDSKVLAAVCQRMRKEYVVEEWQLPDLDSRQWEKMNAPIGLAVAVKHLSTQRIQEQELQIQQLLNESLRSHYSEEKEEDDVEPENARKEIEKEAKPTSHDGPAGSKVGQSVFIAHKSSSIASTIVKNIESGKGKIEKPKVAQMSENDQYDERNPPPPGFDKRFIEDCADWLNLIIPTASKEEETLSTEEAIITAPKIDVKDDGDHTMGDKNDHIDGNDSIAKPTSFSNMEEVAEAKIESDSQQWEDSTPLVIDENKKEKIKSGIEQESSMISAEVEREHQKSQLETEPTESTDSDGVIVPKIIRNDIEKGGDITTNSVKLEKQLEKGLETTEKETKDVNSSDSEFEDNANIFSGIPNSASFSDDEDEPEPVDEENTHPLTEGTQISHMSSQETTLLLYPDNWADDITVAVSNVSPEVRRVAMKRKKETVMYQNEDDSDASSFEIESAALQKILVELPDDDHRSILSQLMIMSNARDRVSRTNLAFQAQDSLVSLIEKHEIDVEPAKAIQIIFHLSRLKKSYRIIFGKSLFKAMSKLYKRSEKLKERKKSDKKKGEKVIIDHKTFFNDEEGIEKKGLIESDQNRVDGFQPE
eukprot:CAMPEP_0116113652 /NCGR_PEP_ID=MMETSP0327-20121206/19617_1 /TAXON_ID=44447 /ORGANISM="Pseudo-nitzschia delicatissima, Strain B596" /LENGTH=633 /DNA_ID=CAMNT_0003607013 /DNA_START=88 /DNA_END=1989 /DNA_ORIENTATION=-